MVFAIDAAGTPSVARIVRVNTQGQEPAGVGQALSS